MGRHQPEKGTAEWTWTAIGHEVLSWPILITPLPPSQHTRPLALLITFRCDRCWGNVATSDFNFNNGLFMLFEKAKVGSMFSCVVRWESAPKTVPKYPIIVPFEEHDEDEITLIRTRRLYGGVTRGQQRADIKQRVVAFANRSWQHVFSLLERFTFRARAYRKVFKKNSFHKFISRGVRVRVYGT